jgi:HNH endonuclease
MRDGPDGSALDIGRKTRVIPTPIRRALAAHHLVHWADGGVTGLDNLVLLCRRHHTLVHDRGFHVERSNEGAVVFRRPDGRRIEASPQLTWNGGQRLRADISGRSLRCWDGTPLNLAYAIDVLHPRANPSPNS